MNKEEVQAVIFEMIPTIAEMVREHLSAVDQSSGEIQKFLSLIRRTRPEVLPEAERLLRQGTSIEEVISAGLDRPSDGEEVYAQSDRNCTAQVAQKVDESGRYVTGKIGR